MFKIKGISGSPGPYSRDFGHRRFYQYRNSLKLNQTKNQGVTKQKSKKKNLSLMSRLLLAVCLFISMISIGIFVWKLGQEFHEKIVIYDNQFYAERANYGYSTGLTIDKEHADYHRALNFKGINHLQNDEYKQAKNVFGEYYIWSERDDDSTLGLTTSLIILCTENGEYCNQALELYRYSLQRELSLGLYIDAHEIQKFRKKIKQGTKDKSVY